MTTNALCSPLYEVKMGKLGDWSRINGKSELAQKLELKFIWADWPTPIITTLSYPSACNSS